MTDELTKIASKVQAAIDGGYKKKAIAARLGITRPTFDSRLKDNCWQIKEIIILKTMGIV